MKLSHVSPNIEMEEMISNVKYSKMATNLSRK